MASGGMEIHALVAHCYQSRTGRFTQLDPLPCSVGTGQRYAYTVGGNPVNYRDPAGTSHVSAHRCWWGSGIGKRWTGRWLTGTRYIVCVSACVGVMGVTFVYGSAYVMSLRGLAQLAGVVGGSIGEYWFGKSCESICYAHTRYKEYRHYPYPKRFCRWYY